MQILDEVVDKDWPGVAFTIVFFYIFHFQCELMHHVPQIFMAFGGFFVV